MLERLGLRDIPRWYRDKYGVSSLLSPGHHHPSRPSHQHWKDGPNHHGGTFKAIQYEPNFVDGPRNAIMPAPFPAQGMHDAAAVPMIIEAGIGGPGLRHKDMIDFTQAQNQRGVHQPGTVIDVSQSPYGVMDFSTAYPAHGHRSVPAPIQQAPIQQNGGLGTKFDLLSINPREVGNGGELSSLSAASSMEDLGKMQRHNFSRNLQAIVPSSAPPLNQEFLANSSSYLESTSFQIPTHLKQQQPSKSRRLFQPKMQLGIPDIDLHSPSGTVATPFGNRENNMATLSGRDSQLTSPAGIVGGGFDLGPSGSNSNGDGNHSYTVDGRGPTQTEPPMRMATATPSTHSCHSSSSSERLPSAFSTSLLIGDNGNGGPRRTAYK